MCPDSWQNAGRFPERKMLSRQLFHSLACDYSFASLRFDTLDLSPFDWLGGPKYYPTIASLRAAGARMLWNVDA
eukprot:4620748-Amphidinium_carterae.1